jgi:hypothetical protein
LTKRMRSLRSMTMTGSGNAPNIAAASSACLVTERGVALGVGALPRLRGGATAYAAPRASSGS